MGGLNNPSDKGSTELYCLSVAADSIVDADAITFSRSTVL